MTMIVIIHVYMHMILYTRYACMKSYRRVSTQGQTPSSSGGVRNAVHKVQVRVPSAGQVQNKQNVLITN